MIHMPPYEPGVTINGVAYRCGRSPVNGSHQGSRCELPVGHEGPIMPRHRHTGRDGRGRWHTWEATR